MKKLCLSLLIISCLYLSNAYAGIIALNTISNDSVAGTFNYNFTTIGNAINGQIQGSGTTGSSTNILAGSLGELDMASSINPRVFTNELLGIGADSTTSQLAMLVSGLLPATSATLTSTISAGTAYINGYRVSKGATTETYVASQDTYVDLSQSGVYTLSAVANGATAPSVAPNSIRLAKVITSGTAVTTVTALAKTSIPGLVVPINYRTGLIISRDSATVLRINAGNCEINNVMQAKTIDTTLDISVAGNWAGGVLLQTTSTMGFVGMDNAGNLKLHTTAPTNSNYALTSTSGKLRYATWSSTIYRILGWFFMNATGSGQVDTWGYGNIKEGDAPNSVYLFNGAIDSITDTSYGTQLTNTAMSFYNSGGPVRIDSILSLDNGNCTFSGIMNIGGANQQESESKATTTGVYASLPMFWQRATGSQGTISLVEKAYVTANSETVRSKKITITEQ